MPDCGAGAEERGRLEMRAEMVADGQRCADAGGGRGVMRRVLRREWALQPARIDNASPMVNPVARRGARGSPA